MLNRRLGQRLTDVELEDLVQDVLLTIWNRLDSYSGQAAIQTWAFRFCHHAILRELAKRDRRPEWLPLREDARGNSMPQRHELVYVALGSLTDEEERIVRWRHFEQLDFAAVGLRLRISESAAKARYYRAMQRLRERMGSRRDEAESE